MRRSSVKRDPIPQRFKSVEEAAEFWDSHDLADYWDMTREASLEVDIQRRVFLTALEPELAKRLTDCARKQGVSTETLINVWLSEKLGTATASENK
ncbi:MAG TPA: CopG family antitoxin [Blastocatellia bacterium]|nr:CopG family antitoxin [Blastocatellia bacterium]